MDIDSLTDDQLDQLASKLAGRLPTGRHGEKIVTTRRQLLAATLGGSAGVAALVRLGIDPATAQQAAGQVGTPSSPEDAHLADVEAQSLSTTDLDTGRTWQDVTNSRAIGTAQTNSTDSEILVNVTVEADQDGTTVGIRFNEPALDLNRVRMVLDSGQAVSIQTTVPSGADYNVQSFRDSTISLRSWLEFRP